MPQFVLRKLHIDESCDAFLHAHYAPLTQSNMYAMWHQKLGRTLHRFVVELQDPGNPKSVKQVAYVQALEVPLFGKKKYLYAPYGPVINPEYIDAVVPFLATEFKNVVKGIGASFVRLDITPNISDKTSLLTKYFTKSHTKTYKGSFFQPRDEWALRIDKDAETLLKEIHPKTRARIRSAEKKGCSIQIISTDLTAHYATFIKLMNETALRNKFNLHTEAYYAAIFEYLEHNPGVGYLVHASVNTTVISSMLFIKFGDTVMYLFAGSSDDKLNISPAPLALWHSIQYAKTLGATNFNFGGISTTDHPVPSLLNLTEFKTRFGGYNLRHGGFYDLVIDRLTYALFVLRKLF